MRGWVQHGWTEFAVNGTIKYCMSLKNAAGPQPWWGKLGNLMGFSYCKIKYSLAIFKETKIEPFCYTTPEEHSRHFLNLHGFRYLHANIPFSHQTKRLFWLKKWFKRFTDKMLQQSLLAKLDTTWLFCNSHTFDSLPVQPEYCYLVSY